MPDVVVVIVVVALIVGVVALSLAGGVLMARVRSRILGRALSSMNRVPLISKLTGAPEPPPRQGLGAMFDVMEGRTPPDVAEPPKPAAAGRAGAGTAVETLRNPDRK
jgi:hypothetical protein